jgi:DNA mismatch endonuclease (patch repair protein)
MDTICSSKRSAIMARIKERNTAPEMRVRRAAHRLGFRFRLHRRDLPGAPDLVFPRLRQVLFVHGCFWHQHAGCRRTHAPKSRLEYWQPKLANNVQRDRIHILELQKLGWTARVIWECETNPPELLNSRIVSLLTNRNSGHPSDPRSRRFSGCMAGNTG